MSESLAIPGQPNPIGTNGRSPHCGWEPTLRVVERDGSWIGYRCLICGLVAELVTADREHTDAALSAAARNWEALKPVRVK